MSDKSKECIQILKDELKEESVQRRIRIAFSNMPYSRRQWPDKIADAVFKFEGNILLPDGRPWPIPKDIDAVLGDARWFSYFKKEIDGEPYIKNVRNKEKLVLISLYFQIKRPKIAAHFIR